MTTFPPSYLHPSHEMRCGMVISPVLKKHKIMTIQIMTQSYLKPDSRASPPLTSYGKVIRSELSIVYSGVEKSDIIR